MKRIQLCVLTVSLAWLSGCTPNAAPETQAPAPEAVPDMESSASEMAPPGQSEEAPPVTEEVPLETLSWEEIQNQIVSHPGKVVVVDLWATYCPPCIAEFPNLVALHNSHKEQVKCISVSLDYDGLDGGVDQVQEKVHAFLKKHQATCTNYLCATDSETMFTQKLEHASIPVVFVYDKAGTLAGQFPNLENPEEFTYQEDVLPLVQKLLASD